MIKKTMPYKDEDLVTVALLAVSPSVIVVAQDSPIKDLKGLVNASRKKALTFSTAGTGSTPHFVAEVLKLKGGVHLDIIPYKSGSEGIVAVLGKQVDATSEASPVVLPQIKGGKLRPLASTWGRRVTALQGAPAGQGHLLQLERVRSLGGEPCLVETIVLPLPLFGTLVDSDPEDWGDLLYPLYQQRCGVLIHRAEDVVSFSQLGAAQARRLRLEAGHPCAMVRRRAFDLSDRCVELRTSRGDAFAFEYTAHVR